MEKITKRQIKKRLKQTPEDFGFVRITKKEVEKNRPKSLRYAVE